MRPSNHEAFSGKNILLASTKPPWTNTPDNFEHVADHLTSPAMNFRPVILKKKYCYLREFTAESSLMKNILLASTKPPWTNTPDNFEHVADHLTSPAMNFPFDQSCNFEEKILLSSWIHCRIQPNIYNQPKWLYTVLIVSFFEIKWWNFLGAMARYLSQKNKKTWQSKAFRSF